MIFSYRRKLLFFNLLIPSRFGWQQRYQLGARQYLGRRYQPEAGALQQIVHTDGQDRRSAVARHSRGQIHQGDFHRLCGRGERNGRYGHHRKRRSAGGRDTAYQRSPEQRVPALTTFPVLSGRADTAATGHFSTLLSGDVLVVVDTSSEKRPPLGAIYRVYAGDSLIAERVRGIDSPGSVTDLIPLSSAAKKWQISRVEVQLIQPGGSLGPRFDLRR